MLTIIASKTKNVTASIENINDAIKMLGDISHNIKLLEDQLESTDIQVAATKMIMIDGVGKKSTPLPTDLKGSSKLKISKATKKKIKSSWDLIVTLYEHKQATEKVISLLDIKFRGSSKAATAIREAKKLLKKIRKDIKIANSVVDSIVDNKLPSQSMKDFINPLVDEVLEWTDYYLGYDKKPKITIYPSVTEKDKHTYILMVAVMNFKKVPVTKTETHNIVLVLTGVVNHLGSLTYYINIKDTPDISNSLSLGYKVNDPKKTFEETLDVLIPSLSIRKRMNRRNPENILDTSVKNLKKDVKGLGIKVKSVKVDSNNNQVIVSTAIPSKTDKGTLTGIGKKIKDLFESMIKDPSKVKVGFSYKKAKLNKTPVIKYHIYIDSDVMMSSEAQILKDKLSFIRQEFNLSKAQEKRLVNIFTEDL